MDKCWCGNTDFSEYSDHYWRCDRCKTLVAKPIISYDPDIINDEEDLYGKQYWESKMVNEAKVNNLSQIVDLYLHERAVYWLKHLFQYLLPGKGEVAEIGCGLGQFSYLLKESGYRQTAYELSPEICGYIQHTLGLNIKCGSFTLSEKKYDAICAFDVMEHVLDPHEFLSNIANSLHSSGILMIQMPCYDDNLSYKQMLKEKPRFQQLLLESEHVHLFSKLSVAQILKEHGFTHIKFIDAFFGNDYDMFFVASKMPLKKKTAEEVNKALNEQKNGRLVKALINAWNEAQTAKNKETIIGKQRDEILHQTEELTGMVTKLEKQLSVSEEDREARKGQIEELTGMVMKLEKQLSVSEEDREARKGQIEELTGMVTKLEKQLSVSEEDREARKGQIEELTGMVAELQKQLKESEEDRENRLQQILKLTDMLNENKQ